eukprot:g23811.t1
MLIVINNVLKAAKNIALFLCSQEVLDDEGYPIRCIPRLPSEEVIMVFRCGTLELVIDELSIISRSYGGILQHLQVSVSCLLIRTDPVKKMLPMYLEYSVGQRSCSAKVLVKPVHEDVGILGSKFGPHGRSLCLDEELVVEDEDFVAENEADE